MTSIRISHARAVRALDALAHDTRLKVHRLLVQAGQDGLSAGFIARKLGLPASSLSFHLMHLQTAELVTQRRAGRSLIYAVDFAVMDGLMAYLRENCCIGVAAESCDADDRAEGETKIEGTSS
jgi:ArsR family transcriptional regulator, arsenate/arsenite/antimonite-responsive transcriptional repressor